MSNFEITPTAADLAIQGVLSQDDSVSVGTIGDWSHVELARVIRREIDRNTKKLASDPNVTLSALIDVTIQYDSDDNGTGTLIVKSGPDTRFSIDNSGNIITDRGGDGALYLSLAAATDQFRFIGVYNSPVSANAAGVKVGGLLASDDYSFGSPAAGNILAKGNITAGAAGAAIGTIVSRGNNAGYTVYDRSEVNGWVTYVTSGVYRIWNNGGTGDTLTILADGTIVPWPIGTVRTMNFHARALDEACGYIAYWQSNGITRKGYMGWVKVLQDSLTNTWSTVTWTGGENGWGQNIDVGAGKLLIGSGTTYEAEFGNPTYSMVTRRNIFVNGISYGSDARLKKNVKSLRGALAKVRALRPATYDWHEPDHHAGIATTHGFIADEVQKVLPEAVHDNEDSPVKGLDIVPILAHAVAAIQELEARVNQLEKEKV